MVDKVDQLKSRVFFQRQERKAAILHHSSSFTPISFSFPFIAPEKTGISGNTNHELRVLPTYSVASWKS